MRNFGEYIKVYSLGLAIMNNRQHLGQTVKNIIVLLSEISSFRVADKPILFEELDVLAMKRNDSNDKSCIIL